MHEGFRTNSLLVEYRERFLLRIVRSLTFYSCLGILRAFPELNPDWLLLDSDMIFRSAEGNRADNPLFSDDEFSLRSEPLDSSDPNSLFSEDKAEAKNETSPIFSRSANGSKDVERIVVLYTDGSFDSYAK